MRVVGGWGNKALVCPEVWWLEVVEKQDYHLKVKLSILPPLFGPEYDPRFLLPKTTVIDVRNGKYSVPRELQKGECPLCGRKGRK